jgi:hypothetical protein
MGKRLGQGWGNGATNVAKSNKWGNEILPMLLGRQILQKKNEVLETNF